MKKAILIVVVLGILGCGAPKPVNEAPFQFLKTKTEEANRMDLYSYTGTFDITKLTEICKYKKDTINGYDYYYLVVFDNAYEARYPQSPFSAEYGVEEYSMSHIKAFFSCSKRNGYSELKYYHKNMWESSPLSITP